jgi:beta-lactamase class A
MGAVTTLDGALLARLAGGAGFIEPAIVLREIGGAEVEALLDPARPLYPASMIKLPIAFALEAERASGALSLDDRVAVTSANMTANDAPSAFVPGYRATLGELGAAMLSASDNVATNVLIDAIGRERIDAHCRALGLEATNVRRKLSGSLPLIDDPEATGRNTHPAFDAARLFERLGSPDRPAWIWNALAAQLWNDKIPAGLQPGDAFAHKTGDTDEVSHDGGILTLASGRTFVLIAYTALPANPQTDARHAAFARALRPYLEG